MPIMEYQKRKEMFAADKLPGRARVNILHDTIVKSHRTFSLEIGEQQLRLLHREPLYLHG